MAEEQEYDAVIKNAVIDNYYFSQDKVVWGNIYGDKKGRFADGCPIHTSYIISGPDENGIVKTRNSTYKVELMKIDPEQLS